MIFPHFLHLFWLAWGLSCCKLDEVAYGNVAGSQDVVVPPFFAKVLSLAEPLKKAPF